MSNKCFVTKLANSVDNDNLLKLGELRIRFKKPTNGFLTNVFNGLESTNKVTVYFPYGNEFLNFIDTGSHNASMGNHFDINTKMPASVAIQVSESYDKEYVDASFIPFYYLTKFISRYSHDVLGFIDSGGNYVGLKPFKYTNIKTLYLDYTSVSGALDDLPKTVTALGVEGTNVTGDISNLKDMVGMTYLGLSNQVTGDISNLKDMVGMTYLSLGNQVTGDISNLKDMVGMTYLNLYATQVTGDISLLANCTALTDLRLSGTKVTGDISNIVTNLTKLTKLTIPSTVTITDAQKKTLTDRGCTIIIA